MNITRFFTNILGAKLRTPYRWGAINEMTNHVFLRVWEDGSESVPDGQRILVLPSQPRLVSASYKASFNERRRHLDHIRNGAVGFGVLCTAVDPETTGARKMAKFDETTLLQLGNLTEENGRIYAHIDACVPVEELHHQRIEHNILIIDLQTVARKKIKSTTKDALVSARVGQGIFRSQVFELWENRCSVTRSATGAAIRASHIKPWRYSTDEERLDPNNGLPLVASLDALFDAGLISFASFGALITSSVLSESERQIFDLNSRLLTKPPTQKTARYLAYHRNCVFRK